MYKVYFVGCGPGDPDLITIKAKKIMQKADVVVYSGSLIPDKIIKICKKAILYDASKLIREEISSVLNQHAQNNKLVIRLHDGDPAVYSTIKEQIDYLAKHNIASEIIPGVTSFLSAAAELGIQLTLPGITQTIILTRMESRTKVPENLSSLIKNSATFVFYLSIHLLSLIVKKFLDNGYDINTPAAVVYRASWDDQIIIIGTLNNIVQKTKEKKITRTAIIIIGYVIKPLYYEYSRLYDKKFTHGFRKSKL